MKLNKIVAVFILTIMMLAQFSFISFNNLVYAADEKTNSEELAGKYHYEQLDATSKKIYEGMLAMKNNGILKTGTQNYDLVANGFFTSEEVKSYESGTVNLKKAFYAARYAFYADFPEIFYVSFNQLAIRTTKDASGNYHVYIGTGNNTSYRIEGFDDEAAVDAAITEFDNKVNEIVSEANSLTIPEGKNAQAEKIKYVHNKLTKIAGYRLETDCTPGNEEIITTPYGILVKGQGVCEGYARAFKTILDKLNIPCILVQGLHQSEGGAAIPHMWNYVELTEGTQTKDVTKKWYAVDVTMDDPYTRVMKMDGEDYSDKEPGWDIVEGFENTRYLLVGARTMAAEHTAIGEVQAAGNYKFTYPELEIEDLGITSVTEVNGLVVKYKQEGNETEEYQAGDYFISYNGMGYKKSIEQGYYLLGKYHHYRPGDEKWIEGEWGYFLEDVYAGGFTDSDDHLYISVPNGEYIEFAVTTVAPGNYQNDPSCLTYQGEEKDIIAQTGKLYNPSGTYKAKPFIETREPDATTSLDVGKTYHVSVTYDDDLILANGSTEAGYKFASSGPTGSEAGKVENFAFDGKRTVTFDFTPSKMFADDGAFYTVYVTGIVGKNSGKAPMEITYGATNAIGCAICMEQSGNWELFARPTLLENADLSLNGWQTEDGQSVSEKLKNRIALVTTKTTIDEKETMDNLIKDELQNSNQEILKSETYNISLNVCKKYIVKTGHRVRLSVGFPVGYEPDDAGVTFKAYHFIKNDQGEIVEVEEIPCVVTPYGLIITCNSFSPFAITVVNSNETETVDTTKQLILSSAENGTIVAKNEEENKQLKDNGNILGVKENESKTFKITPNAGYEIETITVCGKIIEITNKDGMEISVSYDDIKDGNSIVDATFVAKTIVQAEEAKGEAVVVPEATPAQITMPEQKIALPDTFYLIEPIVSETPGIQTYQWYKDGIKLEGKTNKTLEISNVTEDTAGYYTLKVTTTLQTSSVEVESSSYQVVVGAKSFKTTITAANENVNLNELKPGQTFEVKIELSNYENIENGLSAIQGQLEYNKDILEGISVTDEQGNVTMLATTNGWDASTENPENPENLKFITTGNRVQEGTLATIKFKVKDNLTKNTTTTIMIKNIHASDGEQEVVSQDAVLEVGIKAEQIVEPEPSLTTTVYEIDKENSIIFNIPLYTTVEEFKKNVTTYGELVFKDNKGNILNDESIIGTGTTLTVGSKLNYTLAVTQDVNGDGRLSPDDLVRIKLHLIESQILQGAYLKAADIDRSGTVSINDVAKLKLILIR